MAHPFLATVRLRGHVAKEIAVDPGAIGVVVEGYDDGAYEVEFSDNRDGTTIALLTLTEDQIESVETPAKLPAHRTAD